MAEKEAKVVITGKDNVSGVLKSVKSQINQVRDAVNSLAGVIGLGLGMGALRGFLKGVVVEAMKAEEAQVRLANILRTTNDASNAQVYALIEQAKALERIGVVSAEGIITAQGQLATFDLTTASIQRLTPAILDYAVAEKGVNVSTEEMKQLTNGLAQALQGNFSSLTKTGFVLDEATKKTIAHGTEIERTTALVEVLNSTYEGHNEQMTQTTAGAIAVLTNNYGQLKEEIGKAVIPALIDLTDFLNDNTKSVSENRLKFIQLSQFIYIFVGIMKSLGMAFYSMGVTVIELGKILVQWAKSSGNVFMAIAKSALNLGEIFKGVVSGIVKAFKGDWEGAKDTFAKVINESFVGTMMDGFKDIAGASSKSLDAIIGAWGSAGKTLEGAINLKGWAPVSGELPGKGGSGSGGAGGGALAEKQKTATEEIKKVAESYQNLRDKGVESLKDLEYEHEQYLKLSGEKINDAKNKIAELGVEYEKTTANITKSIKDAQSQISDLDAKFNQGLAEGRKSLAETIVGQMEEADRIRQQMSSESDINSYNLQKKQLAKIEGDLATNAEFIKGINGDIEEAKRRAGLSDIGRAIEDYNIKKALATEEYNASYAKIQQEITDLKAKQLIEEEIYNSKKAKAKQDLIDLIAEQENEKALFLEKQEFISNTLIDAEDFRLENTKKNAKQVAELIQKEIDLYKTLADAIAKANSARSSNFMPSTVTVPKKMASGGIVTKPTYAMIGEAGPEAVIPLNKTSGIGSTIINITGTFLSEDSAEKVGNLILDKLKLQGSI